MVRRRQEEMFDFGDLVLCIKGLFIAVLEPGLLPVF